MVNYPRVKVKTDACVGQTAMSEKHDADETVEQRDSRSVNRRRFVRAIGVAGSATALSSLGLSLTSAQETGGDVDRLNGERKGEAINEALMRSETQKLKSYMAKNEWVLRESEATASDMEPVDTTSFTLVIIPFEVEKRSKENSEDLNAVLTWTDHPKEGGSTVTVIDSKNAIQTRYNIENDEIVADITRIGRASKNSGSFQTADSCIYYEERCDDPNWSCLAEIAIAYASCSYALLRGDLIGVLICLGGIGVSLIQAAQDEGCSLCDSTYIAQYNLCRFPDTGTGSGPGSP